MSAHFACFLQRGVSRAPLRAIKVSVIKWQLLQRVNMWFYSSKCESSVRLDGKTAIITGGNTGIGKETAKDFYKRGARVIIACRDESKASAAILDIENQVQASDPADLGSLHAVWLDLASLAQVRDCAKSLLASEPAIHLLVNNAGLMFSPERLTQDGNEMTMQVNHYGHFLLTLMLLPRILASAPARIINLSSLAHEKGTMDFDDIHFDKRPYKHIPAYSQSKLANVLFSKELARRLEGKGVTVYCVHPGIVDTELGRNVNLLFPGLRIIWRLLAGWTLKTSEQGAATTIHCALDEQAGNETGLYYSDCKVTKSTPESHDLEAARKLWDISLKIVGLENYDPLCKETKI